MLSPKQFAVSDQLSPEQAGVFDAINSAINIAGSTAKEFDRAFRVSLMNNIMLMAESARTGLIAGADPNIKRELFNRQSSFKALAERHESLESVLSDIGMMELSFANKHLTTSEISAYDAAITKSEPTIISEFTRMLNKQIGRFQDIDPKSLSAEQTHVYKVFASQVSQGEKPTLRYQDNFLAKFAQGDSLKNDKGNFITYDLVGGLKLETPAISSFITMSLMQAVASISQKNNIDTEAASKTFMPLLEIIDANMKVLFSLPSERTNASTQTKTLSEDIMQSYSANANEDQIITTATTPTRDYAITFSGDAPTFLHKELLSEFKKAPDAIREIIGRSQPNYVLQTNVKREHYDKQEDKIILQSISKGRATLKDAVSSMVGFGLYRALHKNVAIEPLILPNALQEVSEALKNDKDLAPHIREDRLLNTFTQKRGDAVAAVLSFAYKTQANGESLSSYPVCESIYRQYADAAQKKLAGYRYQGTTAPDENTLSIAHTLNTHHFMVDKLPEATAPFKRSGLRVATTQASVLTPAGLFPMAMAMREKPDSLASIRYALATFEPEYCVDQQHFMARLHDERQRFVDSHIELPDYQGKKLDANAYFMHYAKNTAGNELLEIAQAIAGNGKKLLSDKIKSDYIDHYRQVYASWPENTRTVIEKEGVITLVDPAGDFTNGNDAMINSPLNVQIVRPRKIDAFLSKALEDGTLHCAFEGRDAPVNALFEAALPATQAAFETDKFKAWMKSGIQIPGYVPGKPIANTLLNTKGLLEPDKYREILPLAHLAQERYMQLVEDYAQEIMTGEKQPSLAASDRAFGINKYSLTQPQQEYFERLNKIIELIGVTPKEFDDQFRIAARQQIHYSSANATKQLVYVASKSLKGRLSIPEGGIEALNKEQEKLGIDADAIKLLAQNLVGAPTKKHVDEFAKRLQVFYGTSAMAMTEMLDKYLGVFSLHPTASDLESKKSFFEIVNGTNAGIIHSNSPDNIDPISARNRKHLVAAGVPDGEHYVEALSPSSDTNVLQKYAEGTKPIGELIDIVPTVSYASEVYKNPETIKGFDEKFTGGGYCQMPTAGTYFNAAVHNAVLNLSKKKVSAEISNEKLNSAYSELQAMDRLAQGDLFLSHMQILTHANYNQKKEKMERDPYELSDQHEAAKQLKLTNPILFKREIEPLLSKLSIKIPEHKSLGDALFADPVIAMMQAMATKDIATLEKLLTPTQHPETKPALERANHQFKLAQDKKAVDILPIEQRHHHAALQQALREPRLLLSAISGVPARLLHDAGRPEPYKPTEGSAAAKFIRQYTKDPDPKTMKPGASRNEVEGRALLWKEIASFVRPVKQEDKEIILLNGKSYEDAQIGNALLSDAMVNLAVYATTPKEKAIDAKETKKLFSPLPDVELAKGALQYLLSADAKGVPNHARLAEHITSHCPTLLVCATGNRDMIEAYRQEPAKRGILVRQALAQFSPPTPVVDVKATEKPAPVMEPAVENMVEPPLPVLPAVAVAGAAAVVTAAAPEPPAKEPEATVATPAEPHQPVAAGSVPPLKPITDTKPVIVAPLLQDKPELSLADRERLRAEAYRAMIDTVRREADIAANDAFEQNCTQFSSDLIVNERHVKVRLKFTGDGRATPLIKEIDLNSNIYPGGFAEKGVVAKPIDAMNLYIIAHAAASAYGFSTMADSVTGNKRGRIRKEDRIPYLAIVPERRQEKLFTNGQKIFGLSVTSRNQIDGEEVTFPFSLGVKKEIGGDPHKAQEAEAIAQERAAIITRFITGNERFPTKGQIEAHLAQQVQAIHDANPDDPHGQWARPNNIELLITDGLEPFYLMRNAPEYHQLHKDAKTNLQAEATRQGMCRELPLMVEYDELWRQAIADRREVVNQIPGADRETLERAVPITIPSMDVQGSPERMITTLSAPDLVKKGSNDTYHLRFALQVKNNDPAIANTNGYTVRTRDLDLCIADPEIAQLRAERVLFGASNEKHEALGLIDILLNYFEQRPQARWTLEEKPNETDATQKKQLVPNFRGIIERFVPKEAVRHYEKMLNQELPIKNTSRRLKVTRDKPAHDKVALHAEIQERQADGSWLPAEGGQLRQTFSVSRQHADEVEQYLRGDMDYQRLDVLIKDLIPRFEHDINVKTERGIAETDGMVPVTFSVIRGRLDGVQEQHLDKAGRPMRQIAHIPVEHANLIDTLAKKVDGSVSLHAMLKYSPIKPLQPFDHDSFDELNKKFGGDRLPDRQQPPQESEGFESQRHPRFDADRPLGWLTHAIDTEASYIIPDWQKIKQVEIRHAGGGHRPLLGGHERFPSRIQDALRDPYAHGSFIDRLDKNLSLGARRRG